MTTVTFTVLAETGQELLAEAHKWIEEFYPDRAWDINMVVDRPGLGEMVQIDNGMPPRWGHWRAVVTATEGTWSR